MDLLNVKRPSISARATGFIPEMIDLVQAIIDKGFAYVTKEGNVYFSVHKYKEYGKLSGRKLENNLSGERIEIADDKENPEDFALWKSAVGGHIMRWNSPWGVGYPGWHVECSTLCKKFWETHLIFMAVDSIIFFLIMKVKLLKAKLQTEQNLLTISCITTLLL